MRCTRPSRSTRSVAWAAEHGLWVVTDEIYEHLVYGGAERVDRDRRSELGDKVVVLNGVAKTYAMTGWRVGWMIGPTDVIKAATNLQSHATSNVANVAQFAALAAVSGDLSAVAEMRAAFDRRRRMIVVDALRHPRRRLPRAAGRVLRLPVGQGPARHAAAGQGRDHVRRARAVILDEAEVAVVPGEAFGTPGYLRLSYALGRRRPGRGRQPHREAGRRLPLTPPHPWTLARSPSLLRRVALLAGQRQQADGPMSRGLAEDDRLVAVDQRAVLDVRAHRPSQHHRLEVATLANHVLHRIAMAHGSDVLRDDRSLVEFLRRVVRGRADELHPPLLSLVVRTRADECRQERVVDVDDPRRYASSTPSRAPACNARGPRARRHVGNSCRAVASPVPPCRHGHGQVAIRHAVEREKFGVDGMIADD